MQVYLEIKGIVSLFIWVYVLAKRGVGAQGIIIFSGNLKGLFHKNIRVFYNI